MINRKLGIAKRTCKYCGRRIIVKRCGDGSIESLPEEGCGTCKAIGHEKSREQFLMLKSKSSKISYNIKKATERPIKLFGESL